MAYERIRNLPQITEPVCAHLRNKAMIVAGVLDPSHIDLQGHSLQGCWCNLTQRPLGPDDAAVEVFGCIPGRSCYSTTR